jgi:DNA-binding CsgD family transcriptional regulator
MLPATENLTIVEVSTLRPTLQGAIAFVALKSGLSICETTVLGHTLSGDSTDQIAKHRGVSRETIRAQLRACRTKTGTNSQFQLIGLVNQVFADQQTQSRSLARDLSSEKTKQTLTIEGNA